MTTADGLNLALVVVTIVYAVLTYRILKANRASVQAMQDQSETLSRPYVAVGIALEADNPIFYLTIENTGQTTAQDVELSIDKPFYKFGEKREDHNVAALNVFNRPISAFPPRSKIVIALAQGFVIFGHPEDNDVCPHTFCVTARYTFGTRRVEERTAIDLSAWLHTDVHQNALVRKMGDVTKALDRIEKAIATLSVRP